MSPFAPPASPLLSRPGWVAFGVVALKQLSNVLTGRGKPTLASAAIGVSFLATVALDIALIPSYGGLGAAIASSISYTAGGIAVTAIFARSLGGRLDELVPRARELPLFVRRVRSGLKRSAPVAESADELTS